MCDHITVYFKAIFILLLQLLLLKEMENCTFQNVLSIIQNMTLNLF